MSAGNEIRDAARKIRAQADQSREQVVDLHDSQKELELIADKLEDEARTLDAQAKDSDDAETRAERTMDKIRYSK